MKIFVTLYNSINIHCMSQKNLYQCSRHVFKIYLCSIFVFQGTVFFPLPDGNGLLYNLVGTATEPKVAAKITREVPCKTNAVELLPVTNWLKKPQRYCCSKE